MDGITDQVGFIFIVVTFLAAATITTIFIILLSCGCVAGVSSLVFDGTGWAGGCGMGEKEPGIAMCLCEHEMDGITGAGGGGWGIIGLGILII